MAKIEIIKLSAAAYGWIANKCANRSLTPSDVVESLIQGALESDKMMRGFTQQEWAEIAANEGMELILHCGCGAAVTEAEYAEHQAKGHDQEVR